VRIPEDISVIGFDDLPTSAIMDPPLTTVRVATKELGAMAIALLATRIEEPFMPPMKLQIGADLIERRSVKRIEA
jgi:LacI family transcriptional regulator